jgi:predicted transcriptional regulator
MKHTPTPDELHPTVVAFRATPQLVQALDAAAEKEGLKRSDIARRAALRDLQRKDERHE